MRAPPEKSRLRWMAPLFAVLVAACGSQSPSALTNRDPGPRDAEAPRRVDRRDGGAGGRDGSGGAGKVTGAGGTNGAGGTKPGAGGALGAGCALGDAATMLEAPLESEGGIAPDASSGGGSDGGTPTDAGSGPIVYPPLRFSAIGRPVAVSNRFSFAEGPVWKASEQALYFSDINADAVYRLILPDSIDVAVPHAGNPDGLGIDPEGHLIGAGFAYRDLWRLEGTQVVSIASKYRGRKFNSPDDLIVRSDGVIYFTDPLYGIDGSQGFRGQAELCFQGVYRLTPDGTVTLEDQSTAGPNGVELSPNERILFVTYTATSQIYGFRVAEDGSLSDKTLFASVLLADSTCIDDAGDLYVASAQGITVLDPNGNRLGVISTSGQVATNCTFGGPDQRTLFITSHAALGVGGAGSSTLWRVDRMPIPGIPGRP
jgi:gluconolactonase